MAKMKSKSIRARLSRLIAGLALSAAATTASAGLIGIDVSGSGSNGPAGDPSNTVLTIDLNAELGLPTGGAVEIDGIGWDVTITASFPSWLSETFAILGPAGTGSGAFGIQPGRGDDFSGTRSYSEGVSALADLGGGLPNLILDDGILRIEFIDSFDDLVPNPDAEWLTGSTITVRTVMDAQVPEPGTLLLLASGLGVLAARRRRPRA